MDGEEVHNLYRSSNTAGKINWKGTRLARHAETNEYTRN
jgi:hypothetical protein